MSFWWRLLLAISLCGFLAPSAPASGLPLSALQAQPLGRLAQWMSEDGAALDLAQAQQRLREGAFATNPYAVPSFGIGARPVWMALPVDNPTFAVAMLNLLVGTTWIDHVDVFQVQDDRLVARWHAGDAVAGAQGVSPGLGMVLPLRFAPGATTLFVRFETSDPMVLPVMLLHEDTLRNAERWTHYGYGLVYGFLLALLVYNAMVYAGLRERSYLYYALYLLSFLALNLAYTGHSWSWWWPTQPAFQRFVILALMVVFSCCGLLFASRFLDLATRAPKLRRVLGWGCGAALAAMAMGIVAGAQREAALLAFVFLLVFTLVMVGLGLHALHQGTAAGGIFLAASLFGMVGAATTALAVWGLMPLNLLSFHLSEGGILLEASMLALALAARVRAGEAARRQAERLAMQDALTGLLNRRGFAELARKAWADTTRQRMPLTLVMLDIDHFKHINDRHGHDTGDQVLIAIGRLLLQYSRKGDEAARWGGEEFVLLLPGASLAQATRLAERLRRAIADFSFNANGQQVKLSVSMGVVQRRQHPRLEELVAEADTLLYAAKRGGRNRVVHADIALPPDQNT